MYSATTFKSLRDCYRSLRNTNLVKTKQPTEDNLKEFADILNGCLPANPTALAEYKLVRALYKKSPPGWKQYTSKAKSAHLMLWSDARQIPFLFRLRDVIFVKFKDGQFLVEKNNRFTSTEQQTTAQYPEEHNTEEHNTEEQ